MIRMTEDLKITDSLFVFRNCILEDLMKMDYKYIVRDKGGKLYAYSCKPKKRENEWVFDIVSFYDTYEDISLLSRIFADIKWEDVEPFKIPYTNWKEVPVNTPVVYTGDNGKTLVRHFCRYDEESDRVLIYTDGRTSFTGLGTMEACPERVTIYEQGEK